MLLTLRVWEYFNQHGCLLGSMLVLYSFTIWIPGPTSGFLNISIFAIIYLYCSKLSNRHTLPQDSKKSNIYHIYYQDMGLLQVWSSKKLLCLAQWYLNYQKNHDNLYYFLILKFVKNNVCKILYFLPYYRFVQDSPMNYLHLSQLANIVCSL